MKEIKKKIEGFLHVTKKLNTFMKGKEVTVRDLYRFFDKNEIYINVFKLLDESGFDWTIMYVQDGSCHNYTDGIYISNFKDRLEAESDAFLHAMAIMENWFSKVI